MQSLQRGNCLWLGTNPSWILRDISTLLERLNVLTNCGYNMLLFHNRKGLIDYWIYISGYPLFLSILSAVNLLKTASEIQSLLLLYKIAMVHADKKTAILSWKRSGPCSMDSCSVTTQMKVGSNNTYRDDVLTYAKHREHHGHGQEREMGTRNKWTLSVINLLETIVFSKMQKTFIQKCETFEDLPEMWACAQIMCACSDYGHFRFQILGF